MADDTTMSSADARNRWGDVVTLAWHDDKLVHITVNGKPRVVLVSEKRWAEAEAALKAQEGGAMTFEPWIVRHRGGWCALPEGAEPDPDAFNDPTLCGHVVTMRGGSMRGIPDCPDCLAKLEKEQQR